MKKYIVLFSLFTATSVLATEPVDRYVPPPTYEIEETVVSPWYVAPSVTYIKADNDRNSDNDFGLRLGLGKILSPRWNLESYVVGHDLSNYKQLGLGLESQYFFNTESTIHPFWVIGAGALNTKLNGSDETNPMFETGFGVVKGLSKTVDFRSDLRYRIDEDETNAVKNDHFGDYIVTVGVTINFTSKQMVSHKSFAVEEPTLIVIPLVDNDTDRDGVVNSSDLCPHTPKGFKVNVDGCVVENVLFTFDSTKLDKTSTDILDNVVKVVKANPDVVVDIEVQGHTDSTGSIKYNDKLSMKRAVSVKSYLVSNGVAEDNVVIKAFGELSPVESNATKEGRRANRRAVLKIAD